MSQTTTTQLHAALIWGGEPIADVVLDKPGPITIGPVAGATFTVPDLGLPEVFPIVRPGETGYIVQVGHDMTGTVSLGGVRTAVGDLVRDQPFAAAAIRPGDWGVVDLDGAGALQLFFQIAPAQERVATRRWDLESVLPAVAFSVLLHLFLLIASFRIRATESPFVWPGSRSVAIEYVALRIQPTPPPMPIVAPPVADERGGGPPTEDAPRQPDRVRAQVEPNTGGTDDDTETPPEAAAPDVGLVSGSARDLYRRLHGSRAGIDKFLKRAPPRRLKTGTGGDEGLPGTRRDGDGVAFTPTGDGDGDGDGGRCKAGDPDCRRGPRRRVATPGPTTGGDGEIVLDPTDKIAVDDDNLDPRLIAKAIESRQGLFKACFQASLDRVGAGGGEVVVRFVLAPDGSVSSATVERSSVKDATLRGCVQRNIMKIRTFPSSKLGAVVRYPFVFHGGS